MIYKVLLCGASLFIILSSSQSNESEVSKKTDSKKEVLPPCRACKTLVKSFLKGMTDTNRNHFGGGDTAWEEEKLGDYAKSEVRLIEIQESLCSDVHKGQLQCYSLAEEWEPLIEDWWFREQQNNSDFFKWLCIQKSQFCCPENHFGPECKPCDGYPDSICFNNGKCKGAGTREGNGDCICHPGYEGSKCNKCAHLYFESYRDNEKLLCTKCHKACKGSCSSSGPQGCKDCNSGWFLDSASGCLDINECSTNDPCKENEFCLNNEGSYACIACHHSCNGCYGDGLDMCTKCAKGFTFKDGYCIVMDQESSMEWPRYYIYIGLCFATCIIFQKNTVLASLVGLSVAIYVTISEYMLYNISNQSQKPFQ